MVHDTGVVDTTLESIALKPAETDVSRVRGLAVDLLAIDYEGREHVPDRSTLEALTDEFEVRMTMPVRADGFDPLGEDGRLNTLHPDVKPILVAGNSAYLGETEAGRSVAPRLRAAAEAVNDPWIGTEGIERVAMAVGGTQYDLLSATTSRTVRALRAAGFEDGIALYAPTLVTENEDAILDALGEYVSRRKRVRRALPDDGPTDSTATGRTREVLLAASRDFGIVGDPGTVEGRLDELRQAGVDCIVAYPAGGIDSALD